MKFQELNIFCRKGKSLQISIKFVQMKTLCILLLIFLCLFTSMRGQVRVIKPVKTHPLTTRLGLGAGAAGSVLFLSRNVKENNEAYGFHLSLAYGGTKLFRGVVEYTQYQTMDISPTWYNVKASTIESNLHIIARFSEGKAIFYPVFGFSYNVFSGFYTGVRDYLNLSTLYEDNTDVITRWWGINAGAGYEYFFGSVSFFADYKMRMGVSEGYNEFNILDVCLSAGLRWNLKVPTLYGLFRGTRSRYTLKTESK